MVVVNFPYRLRQRPDGNETTLQPPVFYGQYDVAVDEKHRLLIPSEVRRRIDPEVQGSAFFMVVGTNLRPWLYTEKYYEFLAGQALPDIQPGAETSERDRINFAMAQLVELDKQGRILIPARSFDWTGMDKTKPITLLGVRDHLELWDRADWDAERQALLHRRSRV